MAAAKTDLQWWQSNADSSGSPIKWQDFADELCTDGSLQGCGAFFENQSIGSRWTSEELRQYGHSSNCLELLAIYLAIRAFSDGLQIRNICVPADNTTAVSHINTMGGTQFELCSFFG